MYIIDGVKFKRYHRSAYVADYTIPVRLLFVSLAKALEQQKNRKMDSLTQSMKFRSSQSVFASQACDDPPPSSLDDMDSWFLTMLALHIAGCGRDLTVESGELEMPSHRRGYFFAAPLYA